MLARAGESAVNRQRTVHRGLTHADQTARMIRTLIQIALLGTLLLAAWLWWARPSGDTDMDAYRAALESQPGSTVAIDAGLQGFEAAFADLTASDVAERMRALYADRVFFNDTLITLDTGAEVADYMQRTGARLAASEVTVDHRMQDGADVFVRWKMHYRSSAFGMTVDSTSTGMTHLRFDDTGRVVLHQDFWDAAGGLYEHLPIVGAMIRTAKRMMKK